MGNIKTNSENKDQLAVTTGYMCTLINSASFFSLIDKIIIIASMFNDKYAQTNWEEMSNTWEEEVYMFYKRHEDNNFRYL